MIRKIFSILWVTLLSLSAFTAAAQEYRYEIGPALGVSGYLGDLNNSNMYRHPGLVGGGVFRYNINTRWALKANLLYAGISGNTKDIKTQYPIPEPIDFKASLFDVGAQIEFHFLNFGLGAKYKNLKRLSPYMVVGLGGVMSVGNGNTTFSPVLPLGAGLKFRVKERLNLGFEFTMRKAFSDNLDGGISDLYGIKHGFAKNSDWYSVAMFTVTFEFSKRCVKCHYVE